ncbi:Beta-barrel assembly machine subunit BamC [Plasticicumulans lactativorans]|uniref:Beta-barrel assembly machine subunit BamC n=1 Tax=Plasticicumulans lactativorans TaxID=1133106 RepID=A0A4R2KVV6_9GAMM|nr:outer membrane protein assembly factor BamC [Plasticicumulans lactativorans]TCO76967.1 Beta-barrel assembly machine subunit BamC [Plasticicumulans lactativorans]
MRLPLPFVRAAAVASALGLLAACSSTDSVLPDRRADYRQAKPGAQLELPPDLTTSTIDDTLKVPELSPSGQASLSDYSRERSTAAGGVPRAANVEKVLAQPDGMRIEREGERRWLVLKAAPEQVWPKVKEFWTSNGFLIKREDPRIGLLETDWAENRADIPKDAVRAVIGKVLDFAYSAPTRDKFRVRIERGRGDTELYLTHYGAKEVSRGKDAETTVWEPRPEDPELEAEMLSRLMVFLGADQDRARQSVAAAGVPVSKAQIVTRDGVSGVLINDIYDRAWRLVGLALDGSEFAVEDQNRSQGLYAVEQVKRDSAETASKGWFSGLFGSSSAPEPRGTRLNVRLADQGAQTFVVVQNASGAIDTSPAARSLLEALVAGIR